MPYDVIVDFWKNLLFKHKHNKHKHKHHKQNIKTTI